MTPENLKHGLLLAGLVGGALAAVYVLGDGFQETPSVPVATRDPATQPTRDPDEEPHRQDGVGLGSGKRGRMEFDQSIEFRGKREIYRAWQASWASATPRESDDPENPDLVAEDVQMEFFPEPSEEHPDARAVLGPGATSASASRAEISRREGGAAVHADLRGAVRLKHFDETQPTQEGEPAKPTFFTLESEALVIDRSADEQFRVHTDEVVTIRNGGHSMTGTGMDGNSGLGRLELKADVSGVFDGATEKITVTCKGPGQIETLDPRDGVRPEDRSLRRFTFNKDIKGLYGKERISCRERLLVDVPRDEEVTHDAAKRRTRISRLEAYGDFQLKGEYEGEPYSIASQDARSWLAARDRQVMEFLGGTEMIYDGQLGERTRASDPEALKQRRTRLRIRCKGTATSEDRPHPKPPFAGARRFHMVFRDEVMVTQEDLETGEVISSITAPEVALMGNWSEETGRDPEFLKATGGVHLVHQMSEQSLDATAQALGMVVFQSSGDRQIELTGSPRVTFEGKGLPNPFGAGPAAARSSLILTCNRNVILLEKPQPIDGSAPAPGWARKVTAEGDVRLRKIVSETEPFYMRAMRIDAAFGWNDELLQAVANGDAVLVGRAEDGSGRRGWAKGQTIFVGGLAADGDSNEPTEARILGSVKQPATAEIIDTDETRHALSGGKIEYRDGGRSIVVQRNAYASLVRKKGAPLAPGGKARELGGSVEVFSPVIRAELSPNTKGATATQRQLIRVTATGPGSRLAGRSGHSVVGNALEFDAAKGLAVVTGTTRKPARIEWTQSATAGVSRMNWVISPAIRARFETQGAERGKLSRASCDGGTIQGFLVPRSADGKDDPGAVQRVIIQAKGTISVDAETATAERDVVIRYESWKVGRWTPDSQVLCERVKVAFDPQATGTMENRIRELEATGSDLKPVRFTSLKVDATADSMKTGGDQQTVHLTARAGRSVEVHSKTEGYRYRCTPGCRVNYRTLEWNSSGRSELILD